MGIVSHGNIIITRSHQSHGHIVSHDDNSRTDTISHEHGVAREQSHIVTMLHDYDYNVIGHNDI